MTQRDDVLVSTNGATPRAAEAPVEAASATRERSPLDDLRTEPENIHLFRGYGPLVVGIILFVLMVTMAPTVAPEHVVEQPINPPTTEAAP